jgi:hypothetical protein
VVGSLQTKTTCASNDWRVSKHERLKSHVGNQVHRTQGHESVYSGLLGPEVVSEILVGYLEAPCHKRTYPRPIGLIKPPVPTGLQIPPHKQCTSMEYSFSSHLNLEKMPQDTSSTTVQSHATVSDTACYQASRDDEHIRVFYTAQLSLGRRLDPSDCASSPPLYEGTRCQRCHR